MRHSLGLLRSKYASHWNNTTQIDEDIGIWLQSTSSNLREEQRIQAREHHSIVKNGGNNEIIWNCFSLQDARQSYITEKKKWIKLCTEIYWVKTSGFKNEYQLVVSGHRS